MSVACHPARYASSRPWAKRVAHLFAQDAGKLAEADCDALVRRSLLAAPGGAGQDAARQEIECVLARAYGRFVAAGRRVWQADAALASALAATHPPKLMPQATLRMGAACFIVLARGYGAYVTVADEGGRLEVLLLDAAFAPAASAWWQRTDEVLALTLRPGDSLVLPDVPAVAPWREALHDLFNHLAMLAQPRCELGDVAGDAAEQAAALRRGELPLRALHWPQAGVSGEVQREGYWRRQAGNAAQVALVWVPPR